MVGFNYTKFAFLAYSLTQEHPQKQQRMARPRTCQNLVSPFIFNFSILSEKEQRFYYLLGRNAVEGKFDI